MGESGACAAGWLVQWSGQTATGALMAGWHWVGVGRARQLGLHLLVVVAVDVAVATRPHEVAHLQIALLGHHVGQQRIAGDVERHTQKDVCTALVQLARQRAAPAGILRRGYVKLKESVARHERHLVQLGHVPGAHDDAAR
eukprot:gene1080-1514_t